MESARVQRKAAARSLGGTRLKINVLVSCFFPALIGGKYKVAFFFGERDRARESTVSRDDLYKQLGRP